MSVPAHTVDETEADTVESVPVPTPILSKPRPPAVISVPVSLTKTYIQEGATPPTPIPPPPAGVQITHPSQYIEEGAPPLVQAYIPPATQLGPLPAIVRGPRSGGSQGIMQVGDASLIVPYGPTAVTAANFQPPAASPPGSRRASRTTQKPLPSITAHKYDADEAKGDVPPPVTPGLVASPSDITTTEISPSTQTDTNSSANQTGLQLKPRLPEVIAKPPERKPSTLQAVSPPLPSSIQIEVLDYYASGNHGIKTPFKVKVNGVEISKDLPCGVKLEFSLSSTIQQVLSKYESTTNRVLHRAIVFLTPTSVQDQPLQNKQDKTIQGLIQQGQGRRVHIAEKEFGITLEKLGLKADAILTVRNQPYALRVELDNSHLINCGIPSDELDDPSDQSIQIWVEDHMPVAHMKNELVRQLRENKNILGSHRHRIFYRPDSISIAGASSQPTQPPLIELTQQLTRQMGSYPLRGCGRDVPDNRCTLYVQKDPTRWLHAAIKRNSIEQVKQLIEYGADAHLLDEEGHSAFYYAAPLPDMRNLLMSYFPPSPLETKEVEELLKSYQGWLHAGACTSLKRVLLVNDRQVPDDRYVFVTKDQPARFITNEIHKVIGRVVIDSQKNIKGNQVQPMDIVASIQEMPLKPHPMYDVAPTPKDGEEVLETLYPIPDKKPSMLLFDLEVSLADVDLPQLVTLRKPPYQIATESVPRINQLERVSKFRSVITRFDVWKNKYMMNVKLTMLLLSAIGAIYSFSFINSKRTKYGKEELIAQFVATVFKAVMAIIFFIRMLVKFEWSTAKSFVKIKEKLLENSPTSTDNLKWEAYFYFFCLEMADAATILANARILAAVTAYGDTLQVENFRLNNPLPMTDGQSMSLSIYLSMASLVAVNLFDTFISFLADESPNMMTKLHRYVGLHFMVLIQCFSSLRLCFDLRELDIETQHSNKSTGVLSYITPTTMNFLVSYLFGLSIKNLNVTFHPSESHKLMDEKLNAKAISADYRTSIVYVLLTFVVYGSLNNPVGGDKALVDEKANNFLYVLAQQSYFASGLVLSVTAFVPFTLGALNNKIPLFPKVLVEGYEDARQKTHDAIAKVDQGLRRTSQIMHTALRMASLSPGTRDDEVLQKAANGLDNLQSDVDKVAAKSDEILDQAHAGIEKVQQTADAAQDAIDQAATAAADVTDAAAAMAARAGSQLQDASAAQRSAKVSGN